MRAPGRQQDGYLLSVGGFDGTSAWDGRRGVITWCRAALSTDEWAHAYQTGRTMTVEDALNEALAVTGQISGT
jgi:hypothetical protein